MVSLQRFIVILRTLFLPFLHFSLAKKNPNSKKYTQATIEIRLALQSLGVTFIKLGQMLSSRPDMIGYPLANELRNLLDKEPAIPFETIQAIIEKECGLTLHKIVREIDHTPLATASIGQVHTATLTNGRKIIIKVQRPGIQNVIQKDLRIFKSVSIFLDNILQSKGLRLTYVYQEFSNWILNELDLQVEGRRADKFRGNMKSIEGITIPTIYWEHSTSKVLFMSYLEGQTINSILSLMQKTGLKTLYE